MCIRDRIKTNANPYSQVLQTGSALQYLRRFNLPSVSFSGKTAVSHFLPVSVSSLAKQFGSGTAGASVLGGLGWGIRSGEFEEYMTRLIDVYKRQAVAEVLFTCKPT